MCPLFLKNGKKLLCLFCCYILNSTLKIKHVWCLHLLWLMATWTCLCVAGKLLPLSRSLLCYRFSSLLNQHTMLLCISSKMSYIRLGLATYLSTDFWVKITQILATLGSPSKGQKNMQERWTFLTGPESKTTKQHDYKKLAQNKNQKTNQNRKKIRTKPKTKSCQPNMKKSLLAEKATFSSPSTVQPITMDLASKKAHQKKKDRSRTGQRIPRSIPTKSSTPWTATRKRKRKTSRLSPRRWRSTGWIQPKPIYQVNIYLPQLPL